MARDKASQPHGKGLLDYLAEVKDRRRAQGRVYPLGSLLGILLLAAINGEGSLRGMWLWARAHWDQLWDRLGFRDERRPQYGTVWHALSQVSVEEIVEAVQRWWAEWGEPGGSLSIDGKTLRGSKRRSGEKGIESVVAVLQEVGVVIGATVADAEDPVEAALAILEGIPLEGRVVTVDAGLHQRRLVERVLEKGGPV